MMTPVDLIRRAYGPVVVETTIGATRHRVFELLTDPTTYPEWLVGAQRVRRVDPQFPRAGAEFAHSVGASTATIDDTTESLGVREDRHVALLVNAGPFHARVDFDLEPGLTPDATSVRFSERPVGPLAIITPLLKPMIHARNLESLRQLAEYVEANPVQP
ncbi:MAG: SRPBCC family protein [Acidimicrobiales bacterium]